MPLKRAPNATRHPFERLAEHAQTPHDDDQTAVPDLPQESGQEPEASGVLVTMGERATPAPAGPATGGDASIIQIRKDPEPETPAATAPAKSRATPAKAKAGRAKAAPAKAPAAPATPALPPEGLTAPQDATPLGVSFLKPPDPESVRRVQLSHRRKSDAAFSWPVADMEALRAAHKTWSAPYRRYWREQDPQGKYRLTFSSFLASAIVWACQRPDEWFSTVRNDARKEPIAGGRLQVGVKWPTEMDDFLEEMWEEADPSLFPSGFVLTKSHLALAAALYGIGSAGEWVLSCSNDDRYSVPTEDDGRVKRKVSETASEE